MYYILKLPKKNDTAKHFRKKEGMKMEAVGSNALPV